MTYLYPLTNISTTERERDTARGNIPDKCYQTQNQGIDNEETDIDRVYEELPGNRFYATDREHKYASLKPHLKSKSDYLEIGKVQHLEISLEFLNLQDDLHEGAFGKVVRAEAWNIAGKDGITIVAIKTIKEDAVAKDKESFLREIDLMKYIGNNEYVVSMLGFSRELEPYFIILEYMERGNLQSYLCEVRGRKGATNTDVKCSNLKLTNTDLLTYSHQIAIGMDFISSKCIIHRDLATRNILVNELGVCKIAGFGLASGVVDERQYRYKIKGRLPIRWLAPETIDGTNFTTKSDVWSFGILLWEVVTMGNKPYPDMCEWEVTSSLQKGYRMPNPPHCDKDLYATMLSCWNADPQNRPGFSELKTMLFKLVKDEKIYIDVQAINPIDSKKLQNEDGESC